MPSRRSAKGDVPGGGIGDEAVITKLSPWSMADTVARLLAVVAARGMEVFAVIDHSGKARDVGLRLRDTKLVIFGSASAATPVIEAAPLAALDLPLRVVVWQDGYRTLVSYPALRRSHDVWPRWRSGGRTCQHRRAHQRSHRPLRPMDANT